MLATDSASGLHYRYREPHHNGGIPLLLFHGLTGDENVMWVLESGLPAGGFVAAPRAPYPSELGGFSWVPNPDWAGPSDYRRNALLVEAWMGSLGSEHGFEPGRAVYVGFSQGSAVALITATLDGCRPAAVVSLAGFLPAGEFAELADLPVFWGHGLRDDRVPIERARADVARLERAGARVHLCEADVGHKVGVECMHGLRAWLRACIPAGS
jgi:predicted esterase